MTAKEIIAYMESLQNEEQRRVLMGFFKTGPGEYGEGDEFLGLKVPQTREVVKSLTQNPSPLTIDEVPELLMNRWHEVRLCGLLILVAKFEKLATKRLENNPDAIKQRDEILTMYLKYAERANNWDLVDLSVHKILGHWLLLPTILPDGVVGQHRDYKLRALDDLAQSDNLWKQRMSMVCTWKTSQMGDPSWCLRYAEIHLHHLMHKAAIKRGQSQAKEQREQYQARLNTAESRLSSRNSNRLSYAEREQARLLAKAVGWMLREMGKRVSMELLRDFLRQHAHEMPRTMLRYAIEKMSDEERKYWMNT